MPKKLSTNTKAVEARDRKAADKKNKSEAEEKKKEDGKLGLIKVLRNKKIISCF